jgi:NADPH-dependent glutamate synthase beta subunit-like oxidoreductase/Pyruvate/2-oxoacid:ferredoxin oxidoreductase delta subunit
MVKIVKKKKKGLRKLGGAAASSGVETSILRPVFVEKLPPCIDSCPNSNQIRKFLMTISKAEEYGKTNEEALEEAFHIAMETTPFPSVCGRVCPHPCETDCNRNAKEGSVAVNQIERYIGDFGLEKKFAARKLTEEKRPEKIAVVGSGPAGMSCAYQLARRGYSVTVYEAFPKPGGMLRYGIPDYRLPQDILDAEIKRILDMGVDLELNTSVGQDISMDDLRKEYKSIFIGLGAHVGLELGIEGEDASNVLTGTDFLHRVNSAETIEIGNEVVVVGGGDTAIDAARVSRRLGANATILYRRTRVEMPAIEEEIVRAEEEGVTIEFLAAPIEIYRDNGKATGMKCQRMELGEPDSSGRRRPVPIEGDTFDLQFTTLIPAISQEPDFKGFENLHEGRDWIKIDDKGMTSVDGTYSGGDNIGLGLVIDAIYQGRMAALAIHEMISGEEMPPPKPDLSLIKSDKLLLSYYNESKRVSTEEIPVEDRLKDLSTEIVGTMAQEDVVKEAKRCLSCGYCFDCGSCWSFCQDGAIIKPLTKGEQYRFKMEFCMGCNKCAESCPCGYIEMH